MNNLCSFFSVTTLRPVCTRTREITFTNCWKTSVDAIGLHRNGWKAAWPTCWPTFCRKTLRIDLVYNKLDTTSNDFFHWVSLKVHSFPLPLLDGSNLHRRQRAPEYRCPRSKGTQHDVPLYCLIWKPITTRWTGTMPGFTLPSTILTVSWGISKTVCGVVLT